VEILGPLIVLVGPTASGKTDVALELAKIINAEIISADSRQIYKYLNIGTAKPTDAKTLKKKRKNAKREITEPLIIREIPHYLIDIIEPDQRYSAGKFREDAQKIIKQIYSRKKIPLLVGGTGLYIRAITDGLVELPSANYKLRERLEKLAKKYGRHYLYKKLEKVDPEIAKKIHPQNLPRIIRALEVYYLTREPLSTLHQQTIHSNYNAEFFGLCWNRENLYERINQRVDTMYRSGILKELRGVLSRGYQKNSPGLEGLGYSHLIKYSDKKLSLEEAITLWKRDTRHYAKRQMIWFKKDKRIHWIKVSKQNFNPKLIAKKIAELLKKGDKI